VKYHLLPDESDPDAVDSGMVETDDAHTDLIALAMQ